MKIDLYRVKGKLVELCWSVLFCYVTLSSFEYIFCVIKSILLDYLTDSWYGLPRTHHAFFM